MTRDPESEEPHLMAKVKVPLDSFSLDMVFSNVPSGDGVYDNALGLDYHVPVLKGTAVPPKLHVMHVAVEMAPIAKVGGLGDVVLSLGRAVQDAGHMVEVILPKYRFFDSSPLMRQLKHETSFQWGGTNIVVTTQVVEGLRCFFVEPGNGMFDVQSPYGRNDDGVRFDFFCKAAMEFLLQTGRRPDILHCHDWSSAEVARAYWQDYYNNGLNSAKVIFTIHNLEYGKVKIGQAVFHSQVVTTVSPSYAGEIAGTKEIGGNVWKLHGVRNGIDADIWDPETDIFLPRKCDASRGASRARSLRPSVSLSPAVGAAVVGREGRSCELEPAGLPGDACCALSRSCGVLWVSRVREQRRKRSGQRQLSCAEWDASPISSVCRYNADSHIEGKKAARDQLRQRLGMTGWNDPPLVRTPRSLRPPIPLSAHPPRSALTSLQLLLSHLRVASSPLSLS